MSHLLDTCVMCHVNQNSVRNLTGEALLVNLTLDFKCGHNFCKQCSEREFSKKRQFACCVCQTMVKRNTLSEKSLDEIEVFRDADIRKRIKKM